MAATKRNATIELMRFIFTWIIIFYHINNRLQIEWKLPVSFFQNGKFGVEFFFIVSGYLMAANAMKQPRDAAMVPTVLGFLKKKLFSVLPCHFTVYAACTAAVLLCAMSPRKKGEVMLNALPNLLLVQNSGITAKDLMTSEWYISAMLLIMAVLYPLLLRYRERFTRLVCPVAGVLLLGYIIRTTGILGKVEARVLGGLLNKGCLRALCDMCFGCTCYEAAALLRRLHLHRTERWLLTGLELLCYALALRFSVSYLPEKYGAYVVYALAIAVTVSFSGVGYLDKLTAVKPVYALGRFSFPLYMAQSLPFVLWQYYPAVKALPLKGCVAFMALGTAAFAALLTPLNQWQGKRLQQHDRRLHGAVLRQMS